MIDLTLKRTFQVVDLGQQMIYDGGPISDLEAIKLEAEPFTIRLNEYTSHLTTLDSPFDQTMAENVAEAYALRECGYKEPAFDLLVFEKGNDLTFRLAIQIERRPVAEFLALVQVAP